ncbi:MAG: DNA polymerase III subunit delta [Pseudomonadota bacterium]
MGELKSRDVQGFLRRPDISKSVFLFYGPEQGLVQDLSKAVLRTLDIDPSDGFANTRMPSDTATADQALVSEAYSIGMFAGKRLLRVTDAGNEKSFVEQVKTIASDRLNDVWVVIEAGELKKNSALRTTVERSEFGLAVPCYQGGLEVIHQLIDEYLPDKNVLSSDLRRALADRLPADRALARAELEKVSLLASSSEVISITDIGAIIGDSGQGDIFEIVDTVVCGNVARFEAAFSTFTASSGNLNALLFSMLRQFQTLQAMRYEMDKDRKPASAVVASARPPVFFNRRQLVQTALSTWTLPSLGNAMKRLRDLVLQSRANGLIGEEIVHITLLGLTIAASRRRA